MGTAFALTAVLWFLPFENGFITFDSPEAAYEYCHLGSSDIALVIEGNGCDFIVDCRGDAKEYAMIPKTSVGWKIGVGTDAQIIAQDIFDDVVVYVYRYKESADFFVTVQGINGDDMNVTDVYGSQFHSLETNGVSSERTVICYAHLSDFGADYRMTVNGTEIKLGETTP